MQTINQWFQNNFKHPETAILTLTIAFIVALFYFFGGILTPVFASIAIAYLLDGVVKRLDRCNVPHTLSVTIVFILTLTVFVVFLVWLLPLIWRELAAFVNSLPGMLEKGQALLAQLPTRLSHFITSGQVSQLVTSLNAEAVGFGKHLLTYSIASLSSFISLIIYLVLVPLLVFFFLQDKQGLMQWFLQYLPKRRNTLTQVWIEVNDQIANYIRGKSIEIVIVAVVAATTFAIMGLQYSLLLSSLMGLSVLIPFIGATVVMIPVAVVAFLQWGFTADFYYVLAAYLVINTLDGNVLVPLLFSETMKLHPVAIILAILIFGGMWGFWGIFFAIPLATVVKAVLTAWK